MNLYEQITLQERSFKLTEYRFGDKDKLYADHILIETDAGMLVDDWMAGSLALAILSEIDPIKKLLHTKTLLQRCAENSGSFNKN